MTPFLHQIAQRYYAEYGVAVKDMAFVFPNRRAGLFFCQALAQQSKQPLLAPKIYAINDLFYEASDLKQTDVIEQQFVLYKAFCKVTGSTESFDHFCTFGEMLLTDFNDIDKYMADAEQIFHNISDLEALKSDFSWLDSEKRKVIDEFFHSFMESPDKAYGQQFSQLWAKMFELYSVFKNDLRNLGVGYDGMIFRDVIENDKAIDVERFKQIVFIGFNALTTTERRLLQRCQATGKADFYFDYQSPEVMEKGNIANHFEAESKEFKSKFTLDSQQAIKDREVELIAVPSSIGQTKQVYRILKELNAKNADNSPLKTVVVLPDEQLLIPQLHAIPASVETVNVTMGFPLSKTPIAALMEHIGVAQRNVRTVNQKKYFFHKHVMAILKHPLIYNLIPQEVDVLANKITQENLFLLGEEEFQISDLLKLIFKPVTSTVDYIAYLQQIIKKLLDEKALHEKLPDDKKDDSNKIDTEFLERYVAALNRISDNLATHQIEIEYSTFFNLLRQLVMGQTVPFKGEPIEGLQLMGTLETRALDFDNVIITSFNEGTFPSKENCPSIIPYNLRKICDLPTFEQHDAIFAYNFYRLIYRAKKVFLLYDSRTDTSGPASELSRYAAQLEYLFDVKIKKSAITYSVVAETTKPTEVQKDAKVAAALEKFFIKDSKQYITASAINSYLYCQLSFYFQNIVGLKAEDEVSETAEASGIGSIYHKAMELIYKPYENKVVTRETLIALAKNDPNIDANVRKSFDEKFFHNRKNSPLYGENLLIAYMIKQWIKQTLLHDAERAPFKYIASEYKVDEIKMKLTDGRDLNVKAFVDRLDMPMENEQTDQGIITIIDYKTGKADLKFNSLAELFDPSNEKRSKAAMQTFFYAYLYKQKHPEIAKYKIQPMVYALKSLQDGTEIYDKTNAKKNDKGIKVEDFGVYEANYLTELKKCLSEIFDLNKPFTATDNADHCKNCVYKQLCNK